MPSTDPVDPKPALAAAAHRGCTDAWKAYEGCKARVEKMEEPKSCQGWYNDYWKCVDDKVAVDLFSKTR